MILVLFWMWKSLLAYLQWFILKLLWRLVQSQCQVSSRPAAANPSSGDVTSFLRWAVAVLGYVSAKGKPWKTGLLEIVSNIHEDIFPCVQFDGNVSLRKATWNRDNCVLWRLEVRITKCEKPGDTLRPTSVRGWVLRDLKGSRIVETFKAFAGALKATSTSFPMRQLHQWYQVWGRAGLGAMM